MGIFYEIFGCCSLYYNPSLEKISIQIAFHTELKDEYNENFVIIHLARTYVRKTP